MVDDVKRVPDEEGIHLAHAEVSIYGVRLIRSLISRQTKIGSGGRI